MSKKGLAGMRPARIKNSNISSIESESSHTRCMTPLGCLYDDPFLPFTYSEACQSLLRNAFLSAFHSFTLAVLSTTLRSSLIPPIAVKVLNKPYSHAVWMDQFLFSPSLSYLGLSLASGFLGGASFRPLGYSAFGSFGKITLVFIVKIVLFSKVAL